MDGRGKSDGPVVPGKLPNKAGRPAAEAVEGRGRTKGNSPERNVLRTQSREGAPSALERVRQATGKERKQRFMALLHHVYDIDRLRTAYLALKRDAAAGVDGETWQHYGENLEANLQDLAERLKRGAYRAKPVRRAYIPKADGRQRPLGVPTLENKIVQRSVVEVLNAIYEKDFLGFSYGFRPGSASPRREQNGDLRLPGLHAQLREDAGGEVHGVAADDAQEAASEVEGGQGRASAPWPTATAERAVSLCDQGAEVTGKRIEHLVPAGSFRFGFGSSSRTPIVPLAASTTESTIFTVAG